MEKAFIANLVCNMIENVAFIAGIVYATVYFNRFSLLWFLLIPLLNTIHMRGSRNDTGGEEKK